MDIIRVIDQVKPGTFTRVKYCTEMSVASEFKKAGIVVKKTTSKNVRMGCRYVPKETITKTGKVRANNFTYLIPNKVTYNTNTQKYYVDIYNIPASYSKHTYQIFKNGVEIQGDYREYLIPSALADRDHPDMQRITVTNIIGIGKGV